MLVSKLFKGLRERPLPEVGRYGVILARNALGLANPMRSADRDVRAGDPSGLCQSRRRALGRLRVAHEA